MTTSLITREGHHRVRTACLNIPSNKMDLMFKGKLFQAVGALNFNALLPIAFLA